MEGNINFTKGDFLRESLDEPFINSMMLSDSSEDDALASHFNQTNSLFDEQLSLKPFMDEAQIVVPDHGHVF